MHGAKGPDVGHRIICQNEMRRRQTIATVPLTLDDIRQFDHEDSLAGYRDQFLIPPHQGGEQIYLCGNSLGLQPAEAARCVQDELDAWGERAVEGHFAGARPWTRYQEALREPLARLAGARPDEITVMNTLTVNLHLLLVSFFTPVGSRTRIVTERQPFPSDRYTLASQLRWHGLDPEEHLVEIGAGSDSMIVDETALETYLEEHGDRVALVLWSGVHYASGQAFDLGRIARAAHDAGALVGFDLAHAIGNVPLNLHEDGPDFAAWCHYKYLNAGPGAIAGAFVHRRHHERENLQRLDGWWGVGLERRFLMERDFHPAAGADAWQLSTPPTLAMAPLRASLELFEQAGMEALRAKSVALTGVLEQLIREQANDRLEILTPSETERRGCQLSLRVRAGREAGKHLFAQLNSAGIIGDWREPDIIRVAPVPLYNRFDDCWTLVRQCLA
jgi:kynureninase